jgi:hypothetical protein
MLSSLKSGSSTRLEDRWTAQYNWDIYIFFLRLLIFIFTLTNVIRFLFLIMPVLLFFFASCTFRSILSDDSVNSSDFSLNDGAERDVLFELVIYPQY